MTSTRKSEGMAFGKPTFEMELKRKYLHWEQNEPLCLHCCLKIAILNIMFVILGSSNDRTNVKMNDFPQRCIFLCETCDPEGGKIGVRRKVYVYTGKEEGLCPERDDPALQAGPRESSLFPRCIWEKERSHHRHRNVSLFMPLIDTVCLMCLILSDLWDWFCLVKRISL